MAGGTGKQLEQYIRQRIVTNHHQSCTCKMGVDQASVVDPQLRVYGVDGLRIADASIFPTVPTGNTNAPAIMVGEKAADLIIGKRNIPPLKRLNKDEQNDRRTTN